MKIDSKTIFRCILGIFALPGFIADCLICFGLIQDKQQDKYILWFSNTFDYFIPMDFRPIMAISMIIAALPAIIFCLAAFFILLFGSVWLLSGIVFTPINFLFTGDFRWYTIQDVKS